MSPPEKPILFLWTGSPWASKVTTYLALRGIPYTHCEQPVTMPRPDLAALGVKYRRIPLLAMGRDIYCDSLLIINKLESWYAESGRQGDGGGYNRLGAKDATGRALEKLLEKWTDVAVFAAAAAAIPSEMDLCKDPGFQKDREELWGRPWTKEEQDKLKPAGLANLKANFDFLEDLLSDGRQWALGSEGPGLADIHGAWIFSWMLSLPNAMPDEFFGTQHYPKTRAWISRFDAALAKAKEAAPEPTKIEGADAIKQIFSSDFVSDKELKVEEDPEGLKEGQEVEMFPIDTGYSRRDRGKLVLLNSHEIAVQAKSEQGGKDVRIHYPRWNFSVKAAGSQVNGK